MTESQTLEAIRLNNYCRNHFVAKVPTVCRCCDGEGECNCSECGHEHECHNCHGTGKVKSGCPICAKDETYEGDPTVLQYLILHYDELPFLIDLTRYAPIPSKEILELKLSHLYGKAGVYAIG